jgi:hypothetical protein
MEGSVDLPAVGQVKKRYIYIPAAAAAAFVVYRWYAASKESADQPAASDGLYTSSDLSDYGLSTTGGATNVTGNTGSTVTDGTNPNAIDDNAEWTQKAVELLGNAGYDSATVYAALGEFLARRSLDSAEASIARSALAAAGQPPVGGPYSVIEAATTGTATPGTVTGLRVTKTGTNYVNLAWTPVTGVTQYDVYRSGAGNTASRAGAGSTTIYGLQPNTTYTFQVAGVGSTGKVGPKSASVSGKTTAATLSKPATPTASAITRTSFRATTSALTGASRYRWYLNGRETVGSEVPYHDFTGLKANTSYQVAVRGDGPEANVGPMSAARTVKTKK